jgi:hypothetical protein
MKTLHLLIIAFSIVYVMVSSQTVFGFQQNQTDGCIHYGSSRQCVPPYFVSTPSSPSLEDQLGNPAKTTLVHNDAILIVNQTTNKTSYKSGEEITIIPELINIGNKSVDIGYWEPPFFLEIKNEAGNIVWPQSTWIAYIPEFHGTKSLKPGEQFSAKPWASPTSHFPSGPQIILDSPGNYTAISVATLTFDTHTGNIGSLEPLWSKPLQITVVPEFPFTLLVLMIGITSLIVFSRMRFGK